MLKPSTRYLLLIFALCFSAATLAYERNKAIPVEKVTYGTVNSVRNITEKQLIEDQNNGWRTFGGALAGGAIGHQFGGGSGQDIATVIGALIGANMASRQRGERYQTLELVELMINLEDQSQVMILQDLDTRMIFNPGDEVRVVYLKNGVRVDKAM